MAASHVLASLSSFHPGANPAQNLPDALTSSDTTKQQPFPVPPSQPQGSTAEPTPDRDEDDGSVFLGESSSLQYVNEEQTSTIPASKRSRLRHSVPNAVKADALVPPWEIERRRARIKSLQADGAFSFPASPVREELLNAYLRWFHPHFPIVDELDVWNAHRDGKVSPLLLQAMLFMGVIHCEESTVAKLGWGSRHRAKYLFYTRVRIALPTPSLDETY